MYRAYHKRAVRRAILVRPALLAASAASCLLLIAGTGAAHAASVEVRVAGVTGNGGKVNVAVCDKEHFLKDCAYSGSAPAQAGLTVVTVDNVPAGTWAVLAYQDDNSNDKLDRNLLGIPSENYGFSRAARGKFGPPGFADAALDIRDDKVVVPVTLK